jgi:branched-chain amino acid transport system substrate-binding protein
MGAVMARLAQRLKLKVKLLGTSVMAERALLDLGGAAVEGLTLVEPFVFEPVEPAARRFADRFQDTFRQRPTWVAASAYDALGLGVAALEQTRGRKELRRRLVSLNGPERGWRGVTGLTYFDGLGGSLRLVRIVRVEGGAFVPAAAQLESGAGAAR